jgi:GT2 family glycosyltransferase
VNHDGEIQQAAIETLIAAARSRSRVGAVYPLRRLANQEGRFDLSGFSRLPLRRRVSDEKPKGLPEVYWSSSNGALYSLEPARMGLLPRSDLWMGWEDLGYGWALREAGFSQLLATEAEFRDTYEFAALPTSKVAHVSAKPAWYAYYSVRNLILLVRSGSIPMGLRLLVARRIALEVALTATVRRDKRKRWGLIARGIRDGFAGRTGMRVKP